MATITTFNGFFDKTFYQALAEKAVGYFLEDPQMNWIPQAVVTPKKATEYKKPKLGASIGIRGSHKLGKADRAMETPHGDTTYNLEYLTGDIYYDGEDLLLEGKYLLQRKAQEVATWKNQVKQAVFKGVFTDGFSAAGAGQGIRLNDGIIEQATLLQNLNGILGVGGDSLLDAAGDVRLALDNMLGTIPFRYRDGRKVLIGMDDLFVRQARKALFRGVNGDQESELDIWFREHSNEVYILPGQVAEAKPVISDALFLNTVVGATKTELDVLGTNSRLFAAVVDPTGGLMEQAYSYIGPHGEKLDPLVGGLTQRYTARMSGCVHDVEAVVYSERITWV